MDMDDQATNSEQRAQALSILSLLQRLPSASGFPYANIASNTVSGNSLGRSSGISAFAGLVPVSEPSVTVTAASSNTSYRQVVVPQKEYSYKLKIINPKKKKEAIVVTLHNCRSQFDSIASVKSCISEEYPDKVPAPEESSFTVGYFVSSTKYWLIKDEDLSVMYKLPKTDIMLWCDGVFSQDDTMDDNTPSSKKSKVSTKRDDQKEDPFTEVFKDLQKRHKAEYSSPLLRLWARVYINGIHESLDEPPDLPQFGKLKAKSVSGAQHSSTMSPCKVADTRSKYIAQLHEIKSLVQEGVLTDQEYSEQKDIILGSLRKLK